MRYYVMYCLNASLPVVLLLGFFSSGLGDILMAMKMVEREVSAAVKDEVTREAFKIH